MKKIPFVAALVFIAGFLFSFKFASNPSGDEGIRFFEGTWQEALLKAKKEKKPIFLDAYASWCGPCKMMNRDVFPDKELGEYFNKNFINVKMDMEKGDGPQLAEKLGLTAYPTLYFFDQNGKEIKKVVGYQKAPDLLQIGRKLGEERKKPVKSK